MLSLKLSSFFCEKISLKTLLISANVFAFRGATLSPLVFACGVSTLSLLPRRSLRLLLQSTAKVSMLLQDPFCFEETLEAGDDFDCEENQGGP